jgi:hypothetical protein
MTMMNWSRPEGFDAPDSPGRSRGERASRLLLSAGALGEFGAGLALLAYPGEFARRVLDSSLAGRDVVLGRILGFALIALGLSWWSARTERDGRRPGPIVGGCVVYNLGAGLLMFSHALAVAHAGALIWFAASVHLALGMALSLTVWSWSRAA